MHSICFIHGLLRNVIFYSDAASLSLVGKFRVVNRGSADARIQQFSTKTPVQIKGVKTLSGYKCEDGRQCQLK